LRRERWTASVNFIFRSTVPNNMVSINPLGLTIIHYRVDQAYSVQAYGCSAIRATTRRTTPASVAGETEMIEQLAETPVNNQNRGASDTDLSVIASFLTPIAQPAC